MAVGADNRRKPLVSDLGAVSLAVAVSLGAWLSYGISWWVGAIAVGVALVLRRPGLLVAAVFVLATALGSLAAPAVGPTSGAVRGAVTLLSDPETVGAGTRVVVELHGRRVEVWAFGRIGKKLQRLLAGEQVTVDGHWTSVSATARSRLSAKHIVGRVTVTVVADTAAGNPASRAANRIRRLLGRGAQVLPPTERALFTGFVIGDDRAEPPDMVQRFRASGLSHLTAVSGENVAFVLVAAGPLLRRLGLRGRRTATVGLVLWFAFLTRFEPSVLRAASMAGLTATSTFLARPASTIRLLALSVVVCTLLDPLLVHAAGWWLSVGATAGIAVLGRPLAARLPGPRALAEALAVTAAAQVGVAPASLVLFGGVPVVSVPANLLAVPAAAPVMVWGLPAGLLAGVVPRPVATALHLPSLVCIRWIVLVANVGSRVRLGTLGALPLAVITLAVALAVTGRRRSVQALAALAVGLVLSSAALEASRLPVTALASPASVTIPADAGGTFARVEHHALHPP